MPPPIAVNDPPSGSPVAVLLSGTEDTPYTISMSDLLNGFSDVDGDALSVTGLSASPAGSLSATSGGSGVSVTYTPPANHNGAVTLTYSVSDGKGGMVTGATRSFNLAPGATMHCILAVV